MLTPNQNRQSNKSTIYHYLWSHQFYKHLIGPLTTLQDEGVQMAQSLREGSLLACCYGLYSPVTSLAQLAGS